jgi:hypothetical protein
MEFLLFKLNFNILSFRHQPIAPNKLFTRLGRKMFLLYFKIINAKISRKIPSTPEAKWSHMVYIEGI